MGENSGIHQSINVLDMNLVRASHVSIILIPNIESQPLRRSGPPFRLTSERYREIGKAGFQFSSFF